MVTISTRWLSSSTAQGERTGLSGPAACMHIGEIPMIGGWVVDASGVAIPSGASADHDRVIVGEAIALVLARQSG